ncbi:restriction endonuclease subunit S [Rouxiella aceris]|nr:restriction endonuclease subunit S [Rouxiella aceris]
MSWPMGKISDIAEVISGFAFKSEWFGTGDAIVIRIGDLKNGRIDLSKAMVFDYKANNVREQFRIKSGDILMALSGATVGKIAVADSEAEGAYLNQRVAVVRGKRPENSEYLKYVFSGSPLQKLLLNAGGAAQPNLSTKDLAAMEIPIPSLTEQKRISSILDKADGIRQKSGQAIKLADEFLCNAFLEMFGDPVENPKRWKKNKIKKGVLDIISGWSATGDNQPCKFDEFGVLKISSVTSGIFKPEENKVVDRENIPASKKLIMPKKGDLLFSRANTRELVAAICMVNQDYDNIFLPDKLWSIKLNYELLLPEFFIFLIQNEKVRELLTKQATGTSGSMLNISKGKFEETEIIYPDLDVQQKFCTLFNKTMLCKNKIIKSNKLAEESFNSLSKKAFI